MMTTLSILAMIVFPLNTVFVVSPIIGIVLYGTRSFYNSANSAIKEKAYIKGQYGEAEIRESTS